MSTEDKMEWSYNFYINDPISLSQIIEWETSKMGLISSFIHNRIPYLHRRWIKRIIKQWESYKIFNDQLQALSEAKQLINN